jgi:hypothetical protein
MVMAHGGRNGQVPVTTDRQAPVRSGFRSAEECPSGEPDATAVLISASHERHGPAHERGG